MPERKPLFYLFKYFVCVKVAFWCKWKVSGRKSKTNFLTAPRYFSSIADYCLFRYFFCHVVLLEKTVRAVRRRAEKCWEVPMLWDGINSVVEKRGSVHVPNCMSFLGTEAERKHVKRRAPFQQHGDESCHQVFFFSCKARRRRKFTPFWKKH